MADTRNSWSDGARRVGDIMAQQIMYPCLLQHEHPGRLETYHSIMERLGDEEAIANFAVIVGRS